jgi:hypothetical protein
MQKNLEQLIERLNEENIDFLLIEETEIFYCVEIYDEAEIDADDEEDRFIQISPDLLNQDVKYHIYVANGDYYFNMDTDLEMVMEIIRGFLTYKEEK